MKRWILRGLVFLLIGAVVNIAVAWGPQWLGIIPRIPLPMLDGLSDTDGTRRVSLFATWYDKTYRAVGSAPSLPHDPDFVQRSLRSEPYPTEIPASRSYPFEHPDTRRVAWSVWEVGFPMRCLWGWMKTDLTTGSIETGSWMIEKRARNSVRVRLPSRVIWPAMIIDVIAWAGICAVVPWGFRRIRGALRVRKGQCPVCKYPIGTSPVCTECGGPVKARKDTVST